MEMYVKYWPTPFDPIRPASTHPIRRNYYYVNIITCIVDSFGNIQ